MGVFRSERFLAAAEEAWLEGVEEGYPYWVEVAALPEVVEEEAYQ